MIFLNTNNSDRSIRIVLIVFAVLLLVGAAVGLMDVFQDADSPTVTDTETTADTKTETTKVCDAHVLDNGTVTVTANCTRLGKTVYKCTKCDYSETKTLPKTDHELTYTVVTSATSTAHGKGVKSCKTPGCSFAPIDVVLHYSYTDGYCVVCQSECEHDLEPTYDSMGFESGAFCPLCGYHEGY